MPKPKGRDASKDIDSRRLNAFKQYEGDIFIKHEDAPESTAIAIREDSIALHTKDGNVGILIKNNGKVVVQGKLILKSSGSNIVKGDYTENPLSFISSTGASGGIVHSHSITPAYLRRFPEVGMINSIKNMLEKFQNLF